MHDDVTREDAAELLQSPMAAGCPRLNGSQQIKILNSQFADTGDLGSSRPMPGGYRRVTDDVLKWQHDNFWRGFILVGIVIVVFGGVIWSVLGPKPWLLAVIITIVVLYACLAAWRTLRTHGIAGLGQKTAHLTTSAYSSANMTNSMAGMTMDDYGYN